MCFIFVLFYHDQTGYMLLVVSASYETSRYGNRFSHDPGKTFKQWTIHKRLVMTVVKQSRTDVNRNL